MSETPMTEFEKYALNHSVHSHCIACGTCMLDPRVHPRLVNPVWCISCYRRIDAVMPADALRPWHGGYVYAEDEARRR